MRGIKAASSSRRSSILAEASYSRSLPGEHVEIRWKSPTELRIERHQKGEGEFRSGRHRSAPIILPVLVT
jgi:hypothetical protein